MILLPRRTITACLLLGLAACQDEHATLQPAAPAVTATASLGAPGQASSRAVEMLSLQPSRLETCDSPAEVEISWDLSAKRPDVKGVELWVARSVSADEKLFAASLPAFGKKKTGAWMQPGGVVILKAQGSAEELQRSILGGPGCT